MTMRLPLVTIVLMMLTLFIHPIQTRAVEPDNTAETAVHLYMPDGQLNSHPIKVFINKDISRSMHPKLRLTASHAITEKQESEDDLKKPMVLARHQEWVEVQYGNQVRSVGTLMLFDLSNYPIPFYKATMRLTPTLIWVENGQQQIKHVAIGNGEVYLGNSIGAFTVVLLLIGLLVLFIISLARKIQGSALALLCDSDGSLSLWRTQIALWTVAIGGVVAGYGLIRLQTPDIPESLVALMGMSLGTGGISHYQTHKKKTPTEKAKVSLMLSDLICDILPDGERELSLARAQMLFWTVLVLVLFVAKSVMDGNAWNVPWELVALMGISQVGYLSPKMKA